MEGYFPDVFLVDIREKPFYDEKDMQAFIADKITKRGLSNAH